MVAEEPPVDTDVDVETILARSERWHDELAALRELMLGTGLDERVRWGQIVYAHHDTNVAILSEFSAGCTVGFFKGELLDDPEGLLEAVGPNSRSARRLNLTSVGEVEAHADAIRALVASAVAVEEAGLTVGPAPEPELSEELVARLDADEELRTAWEGLTPGRRRAWHLHVSSAKRSETRAKRVAAIEPRIRAGKGPRDR